MHFISEPNKREKLQNSIKQELFDHEDTVKKKLISDIQIDLLKLKSDIIHDIHHELVSYTEKSTRNIVYSYINKFMLRFKFFMEYMKSVPYCLYKQIIRYSH